ncbi:hypothetical protein J2Z75_003165 [Rhizobium herbae]|uniref:Uncharacterized protein n=1 Tax=Rhizobium herbae TaxID=508661 RepID=A0ABS4ENW7_9HYPH|nr:hypothetical protein [Rhizobium herbae]
MSFGQVKGPDRIHDATRRKGGSDRGLPRSYHHNSHARYEVRNLIRHWITFLSFC